MGVSKVVSTIINNGSVIAGGTLTSSGVDLSSAIDFSIGLEVTFPAGANGNLKYEMFGDPTSLSQDFTIGAYDLPLDSGEIVYSAGNTIKGVFPLVKFPKFAKIKITNLGSIDIASVNMYSIIQVA